MRADRLFDLSERIAVVTGAASGLGRAIADVLMANGATVHGLDRDAVRLAEAAEAFGRQGYAFRPTVVDVADLASLRAAIDAAAAPRGLDVLVANAGISGGPNVRTAEGAIEAVADDLWARVHHVNLTATFAAIQAAARSMKARRRGRIVVIASIAGMRGDPMTGYAYASSKGAVVNVVRQAAFELAPFNVLVNGIAPGPFRTNIAGGRIAEPAVERAFADTVPLGRIAETEEIKGLALLLASPATSFMTGAVIPIDGGTTAI